MMRGNRITWLVRVAARDAHAQMGSLWVAVAAAVLIAIVPIAAFTGFEWNQGTKLALVAAVVSYPITFICVVIAKALEQLRHGHSHFASQVEADPSTDRRNA
jgi:formate/nitrite transporter FocA (FNT family)